LATCFGFAKPSSGQYLSYVGTLNVCAHVPSYDKCWPEDGLAKSKYVALTMHYWLYTEWGTSRLTTLWGISRLTPLQDGDRVTHVTHFVRLYPQPLYTASQVRTTCRSWDKGVLTDLCLTLYIDVVLW